MRKLLPCPHIALVLLALFCGKIITAQTPFYDVEYIDINNISAATGLHGDLWHSWSNTTSSPGCEFPKGSGKHLAFAGGLWMAGFDNSQQLRGAATTYRSGGQEYWPGPLQIADSSISYPESQKWARTWKISRADITTFLSQPVHTIGNTAAEILEWPAKGNIYAMGNGNAPLTITDDMAPFIDADNNGVYDPLQGDYPAMKGDQMLWFVFNDNGPVPHNEITFTPPAGIEVKAIVYGYNNGSLLNNVLYYEFDLRNTMQNLDSFIVGTFADLDLGYAADDYIGFDSSRNMGFTYNSDTMDGTGQPDEYKDSLPMAGIRFLEFPGNNCSTQTPLGSFMYYNPGPGPLGTPVNGRDVYNYLHHTWRDSMPLRTWSQGWVVYTNGYNGGAPVKYVYSGNPMSSGWNECNTGEPPGDRRFIIAIEPMQFNKGARIKLSFALVAADRKKNNSCPNVDMTLLQMTSDSAQAAFCNPPALGVNDVRSTAQGLRMFPNPVGDNLSIDITGLSNGTVKIYNMVGLEMPLQQNRLGTQIEIETRGLLPGAYMVVFLNEGKRISRLVVKD